MSLHPVLCATGIAAASVDRGCVSSHGVSGGGEGCLELDGGEPAEAALASAAVVGVLDPADDPVAQLLSGAPGSGVQGTALEQCPEALQCCESSLPRSHVKDLRGCSGSVVMVAARAFFMVTAP